MIIKDILKFFLGLIKKFMFWRVQNIKIKKLQKKIHIIRTDTIGDFVLFSAVLPYFKKLYPEHKIILVAEDVWQELARWLKEYRILGDGQSNYFDELIAINGKFYNRNPFYYYKILKRLKLSSPEIVINPIFSRTLKSDELVFISKGAKKIGYDGDLFSTKERKKKINDKKYNRLIGNPNSNLEIDRNKHFLNEIAGYELVSSGLPKWKLNEELLSQGRSFLKSFGIDLSRPILMIFPGSSLSIKRWPINKFVSLILKLFQYNSSLQFVLIGGIRDKKKCFQIAEDEKIKNLPIYNLCGKTKLSELAKILAVADLYIGNDTGAMHMAAAVGTSAIGLIWGAHIKRFFPYSAWKKGAKNIAIIHKMDCFGCDGKCKYGFRKEEPVPCIKNIRASDVYNQVIDLWRK